MDIFNRPFIGSEALAAGLVAKHELRNSYTPVFPDVYAHPKLELTLAHRARAAWLWSHREGVIAGLTASGLHGAKWIDDSAPIELVAPNARPPHGIRTFDYWLPSDEYVDVEGMRVVTRERAAFDIGRPGRVGEAVARLDALGNATRFQVNDVANLALRHRRARGLRQLTVALSRYDPGAESPRESWLRLLLEDEGFPRPQTQIPILGPYGRPLYFLDMGWEDVMIAVDYDGEDHRERARFGKDLVRSEYIARLGWIHIRVMADHRRPDIVRRVRQARDSRLR